MYVDYYVVPIIAVPKDEQEKFRFLGTGFFVGDKGHLVTCAHVVKQITPNESLHCYQIGRKREITLEVIKVMTDYDLALCLGDRPQTKIEIPIVSEPFVHMGSDIDTFGYLHEPRGQAHLPFTRRIMKGHIVSIPDSSDYPDSYELSFPALFGFSGAPLLYSFNIQGKTESKLGIAGCIYGSRETGIVKHSELVHEVLSHGMIERETETISRIVELGLAYTPKALFKLFHESDIKITVYSE